METDRGFRIGEICEMLGKLPAELREAFQIDLDYLSFWIDEKYRRIDAASKGSS